MGTKIRVELNDPGVEELLNDPGVVADLERRAARIVSAAQSSAPVETGTYRDSIDMNTVRRSERTVVQVGTDVPYGMIIEANTGNLARALDAAGGA